MSGEVTRSPQQSIAHVLSSQSQAHVICANWIWCALILAMKVPCSQIGLCDVSTSSKWSFHHVTFKSAHLTWRPVITFPGVWMQRSWGAQVWRRRQHLFMYSSSNTGWNVRSFGKTQECVYCVLRLARCHNSPKAQACCGRQAGKYNVWAGARVQSHRQPVGGSPALDSLLQALQFTASGCFCCSSLDL